jgi:predicted metal-dependent hydrolase
MINLLGHLRVRREAPKIEPKPVLIGDTTIMVSFRRNALCKRMVLRLTSDGAGVRVTVPPRASAAEAIRFVESSKPWIAKTLMSRAPVVAFKHGQKFQFRGIALTIEATGGRRGLVHQIGDRIIVPGDEAHVTRRLLDWLKLQAKSELSLVSKAYATAMSVNYRKLTVRDQNTRWGSCSAAGDLSYSWRLILAPEFVLDYVAAHEVAHLKEMNHGPKFWRLVITHCKRAKEARDWLRLHGRNLHRYGGH